MKVFSKRMESGATPRKCAVCLSAASIEVYAEGFKGLPDKSSRRFVCGSHAPQKEAE